MLASMFVALEGGEGAGKSTLAAALRDRIEAAGRDLVLVREPGGTRAGEQVRLLLHERLAPWAEVFAFLTARAQLVAEVIRPALARGAVVICDRFEASTFAYQGYGRGMPLEALETANRLATGGTTPNVTIYLDIDPAAGLARKQGETEAVATGFEAVEFHRRVRRGYHVIGQNSAPGTWLTLDATRPQAEIAADAAAFIGIG